ncbi:MAG: two-component regulator propeller domain-containing protein [Bacteroidota bacterium]
MLLSKITVYKCTLFLFSLLLLSSCEGQATDKVEQQSSLPRDAQIGEYVVAIFEDSKGHLWFGTMSKGVARYDGQQLQYFTTDDGLCGNTVLSLAEDSNGHIWMGTHSGASRYDGKTFTNFGQKQGLHGAGCKFLIDSKGTLWAGTNHGLFRYQDSFLAPGQATFQAFELPIPEIDTLSFKWELGKIWSLMEDSKGNLWFGRDGYGACKFDGQSFTHFTKKEGLCSNIVSDILEDRQGNIWLSSLKSAFPKHPKEGGLNRFDGKSFTQFPEVEGLHENDIYTIYKDLSGNIWIGALGIGAYRYDGKNFTLLNSIDHSDLTPVWGIQAIHEDRNGKLWFGFSGGLYRLKGPSFVNIQQNGPWR